MNIVIVMPAYRAAKTIGAVFERIPRQFYDSLKNIVVVNDGSTDDTAEVLKALEKRYPKISVIAHEKNRGYGAAQKTGFAEAVRLDADIAILLHSDGQYPPEMLPKMIAPISDGNADVVIGSRILGGEALKGGMPLYKYLGNRFLTALENIAYGMDISEYHTGYCIYSRKALQRIPFDRLSDTFHFDGEMIMMSGKKGLRLREIGIPTRYADEKSHLNPFIYGLDVLRIILRHKMGKYDF